jgi:hypothetical protein
MNPTQHRTSNRVLGAPPGWNQAELPCNAVAIRDGVEPDTNLRTVTTHWRPDADELALLNRGGLVTLTVPGITMAPARLGVEAP